MAAEEQLGHALDSSASTCWQQDQQWQHAVVDWRVFISNSGYNNARGTAVASLPGWFDSGYDGIWRVMMASSVLGFSTVISFLTKLPAVRQCSVRPSGY